MGGGTKPHKQRFALTPNPSPAGEGSKRFWHGVEGAGHKNRSKNKIK
ncbi:MAG: hypothetical protein IGQ45_05605 [Cyanobacterium sp. T60_A2020_053]|nr:hypothetical protein [Cyanobacterium sp. T60_A2020_053]